MKMKVIPKVPWLFQEEQRDVVARLLELKLLKFDNGRSLPLKKGGTTDVYINLRDARDNPEGIELVSGLFEIPLRRLNVKRFVEVPDSVSCFAGPLSLALRRSYLTIREQAKEGRVADATMIGHSSEGDEVAIIDDVITDGASKIVPWRECVRRGLTTRALVVLVDRQQGWQDKFAKEGINLPVWPGMTLHDVRRHLIQTLGVMKRCDPKAEEANPIILALDGKNWDEILPVIDQLRTTGCILKVNDYLFDQGISNLLPNLSVYGRVMADLKCHDISNTVENTCKRLRPYAPWAVTVHASGGEEMIKAAVKTLEGTGTKILAVTVLTSIDETTGKEIYTRLPIEQVRVLAGIAKRAGAHGLVCSVHEVAEMRNVYPSFTLVTPGVRSPGEDTHDQQRVDTPKAALDNGANFIVGGRQFLNAIDPVAEVKRVLTEELGITI